MANCRIVEEVSSRIRVLRAWDPEGRQLKHQIGRAKCDFHRTQLSLVAQ